MLTINIKINAGTEVKTNLTQAKIKEVLHLNHYLCFVAKLPLLDYRHQ